MLIPLYLLQAVMEQALGRLNETEALLEKAIGFAAAEGYVQPFIEEGADILDRLQTMRHIAPSFADKVLLQARAAEIRASQQIVIDPLTPRELEVLQLIAQDLTNQEIADHFVVALSTVKKHINRIFFKLEARDRTQAVLKARELNLL